MSLYPRFQCPAVHSPVPPFQPKTLQPHIPGGTSHWAQHPRDRCGNRQGLLGRTLPDPRCLVTGARATSRCLASVLPFAPRFLHLGCNFFPPSLHLLMEMIYNRLTWAA